jgi:multidrug efflux pump
VQNGFAADWTGQSYQELLAGSSVTVPIAVSILVVFL